MECPTSGELMDAFAAACDRMHYEGAFARGHVAADLIYGEFQGEVHPKGITFFFMVLVKHMWIAYCNAVHGRGDYRAPEIWRSMVRRVRTRIGAHLYAAQRLMTRLEEWVHREEGPQAGAILGEQKRREKALKPLGVVDWGQMPPAFLPAVPWEELLGLVQ